MSAGDDAVKAVLAKVEQIRNEEAGMDPDLLAAEKILNGGDDYTDRMAVQYMLTLMKNTQVHTPAAYRFCAAAAEMFSAAELEKFGFPKKKDAAAPAPKRKRKSEDDDDDNDKKKPKPYSFQKKPLRESVLPEDWEALKKYLDARLLKAPPVEEPTVLKNLLRVAESLGFSAEDKDVLRLLFVAEGSELDSFLSGFSGGDLKMIGPMVARAIDQPKQYKRVAHLLSEEGPLVKYGLFHVDHMGGSNFLPESDEDLWMLMSNEDLDEEALLGNILGKPMQSELTLDDFSFIGKQLDFIADLVAKAVAEGRTGINVLFYGPPGSGKTELAKALASSLGIKIYSVGEEEQQDKERTPIYDADGDFMGTNIAKSKNEDKVSKQRLSQLRRAQALLKGNAKAAVLFDEMDDLLMKGEDANTSASNTDSKIGINRLLENNPVVTIWTGNDTEKFHEAVRDRFTFSLYVDYPPTLVRKKMWDRQLEMQGVKLPAQSTLDLARRYDATPRQIAKAVKSASITGKGMETIEISMPASAKISRGNSEALSWGGRVSRLFTPGLLNADGGNAAERIETLIKQGSGGKPFALLATGTRGTGVNAALRYIGEQLTMNTLEVSMAALAQPGGQSSPEENIRTVFNIAADGRRFLVIRDIEHLVVSPESRNAQWQKSPLVETFKQCALSHRLPFAVTSHKAIEFPESFAHVFSQRLDLKPLDAEKTKEAFKVFFNYAAKARDKLPEGLVLSDFANARRLAARQEGTPKLAELSALLEKQKEFRGLENKGIGF